MHRPITSIFAACLALATLACEEEPPPYFAEGTFGAANRERIEDDCDRRIACAQRKQMFLRDDVFENCVETNASNLNADPEFQFRWLLGTMRCYQQDPCAYVDCIDGGYQSWGQTQVMKITFICEQLLQCHIQSGTLGRPEQEFRDSCKLEGVLAADMVATDLQTHWVSSYFQCETQLGCAFDACFPY